jgi:hypothetical protein
MMIPMIRYKQKTICFMADLLPSVGHIPLPYVMGYDTRPLITLTEKEFFLNEAADNNYILFLEHDPVNECCTVKRTEKGVRVDQNISLKRNSIAINYENRLGIIRRREQEDLHILGVMKALEEFGITFSEISGTSAGSIAGAFYCSGYKPDEILDIISKTGFLKSVRPAWAWTGLLSMDGFRDVLCKYLPDNSFEKLKIPLTVSATEIRHGRVTYFNSGELISRVIASSSIPALI